ncbi:uncharacterized protein LOC112552839 [Pogonomyrmex barbatus]|uniref:Uncharacterized protein LOC112552839 n=1 Tax=Pogonomyrmex barbatus TaxID=144034 RepID=A0A8N1S9X9_9HYME|nr:uncharacterized protein LOC112552839 [Pogonomyrmex barbatus]
MRILGIGLSGLNIFCGLMNLCNGFTTRMYYTAMDNIYIAAQTVHDLSLKNAAKEEIDENTKAGNEPLHLSVSDDGTWSKRGFSSLFGVVTLIGKYTNKIVDVVVKSSFCKACSLRKHDNSIEDLLWQEEHAEQCTINHSGSAGKMEVIDDGVIEMFQRSQNLHGVMYENYIGDGDSKTFKSLINENPYEDKLLVKKKECIAHVQKRMGSRLRNAKKLHKDIGGKGAGKLTEKLIKDLTIYYGLAIRRNTESLLDMKNAVWATYYHKISTDEEPMHSHCPSGSNSWCSWRVAEGALQNYHHDPPLSSDVQTVIYKIYEDLSDDDLLTRCLGGQYAK